MVNGLLQKILCVRDNLSNSLFGFYGGFLKTRPAFLYGLRIPFLAFGIWKSFKKAIMKVYEELPWYFL